MLWHTVKRLVLEQELELEAGALKLEIMVETTHCLIDPKGRIMLPRLLDEAVDGDFRARQVVHRAGAEVPAPGLWSSGDRTGRDHHHQGFFVLLFGLGQHLQAIHARHLEVG